MEKLLEGTQPKSFIAWKTSTQLEQICAHTGSKSKAHFCWQSW